MASLTNIKPTGQNNKKTFKIVLKYYQSIKADAHVKPLPKAAKQIVDPSLIRPFSIASLMAIGIEAAVVLP